MRSHKFLSRLSYLVLAAAALTNAISAQQAPAQATSDYEYQVGAVLFMQKSAEYRALAYQAFNLARWQLDADLDKKNVDKLPREERNRPRAIVVDVDETVLDNSGYQAMAIKGRGRFSSKDFQAFTDMRKSKAVPGAVDLINYANAKGVKVFYISNRDEVPHKQATIDNLKSVGFTDVSADNVLLRNKDSSKGPRRQFIEQKYRIVLLIGDNLDDLSDIFEQKSITDRFAAVEQVREKFGKRFIVLPNAMYGTWEKAIYDYARLPEAEKAKKRAEALELP